MSNKILIIGLLAFLLSGCVVEEEKEEKDVQGKAWPKGIIYYEFMDTVNIDQIKKIKKCMALWGKETNVIFKEDFSINYRLRINITHSTNDANIGKIEGGSTMNISWICDQKAIIHELGHVLGCTHEHQRPDRDDHITILWENIQGNFKNFSFKEPTLYNWDDYEYDILSIMHYEPRTFGGYQRPAFEIREDIYGINYPFYLQVRAWPTRTDYEKINDIYNSEY